MMSGAFKRNILVLAILAALGLFGRDAEQWNAVRGGLYWPFFHCAAVDGVYDPGAEVTLRFSCSVTNGLVGEASAVIDLREFGGATVSNAASGVIRMDGKRASAAFSLTAPKRFGHYTAAMRIRAGEASLGTVQTAFVVAPPPSDGRDPYFTVDKNCWEPELLESMKRFGFGSSYYEVTSVKHALEMSDEQKEAFYRSLAPENRKGPLGVKGYEIVGSYRSHVLGDSSASKGVFKRANERLARGLWPLTDEDFAKIREHARRTSAALKDLVRDWVNNEEFDAFQSITHDSIRENRLVWSVLVAQVQANIARGLKEGNPDCTVAVLGPCCYDYFWEREKFNLTRRLLSAMRGSFDYLAIDAYSGNWNGFSGTITPPEDAFAQLLRDAAKVSEECGGPRKVVNAERCAAVDGFSAYDGALARAQADYTSRSMIINKTVEECTRYTLHLLAIRWPAIEMREKSRPYKPYMDLGIWQVQALENGKLAYTPRPAVLTAGVAARKLAWASKPRHLKSKDNLHAAVFDVGADRALAAVWTTEADVKVSLTVPAGAVFTDVGGNDEPVAAGAREQRLTTSPVYFTVPRSARTEFEKSLAAMSVTWRSPEAAQRFVPVGGQMPKEPSFVLAAPDAVWPKMAVMPEYGFFGRDLRYTDRIAPWPYAEVRFAWRKAGLAAEVRIVNKPYVAGVDRVRLRLLASDGLKLYGEDGYARRPVCLDAKNVAGDANGSTWRFTLPWSDLKGMKPEAGAHVACNVICDCVPLGRTDEVKYALANDSPKRTDEEFRYKCVFLELK